MRESLASALDLPPSAISVKFKTAEAVGPVGQGTLCECHAIVLLTQS